VPRATRSSTSAASTYAALIRYTQPARQAKRVQRGAESTRAVALGLRGWHAAGTRLARGGTVGCIGHGGCINAHECGSVVAARRSPRSGVRRGRPLRLAGGVAPAGTGPTLRVSTCEYPLRLAGGVRQPVMTARCALRRSRCTSSRSHASLSAR
jgi:hypothetical protein